MTDSQGRLIWISDGLPGSTHDLSAACTPSVFAVAACAELYLSADKGYVGGAGATLLTPDKGRSLPDWPGKPTAAIPRSAPTANAAPPS